MHYFNGFRSNDNYLKDFLSEYVPSNTGMQEILEALDLAQLRSSVCLETAIKHDDSEGNEGERKAFEGYLAAIRKEYRRLKIIGVERGFSSNRPDINDLLKRDLPFNLRVIAKFNAGNTPKF